MELDAIKSVEQHWLGSPPRLYDFLVSTNKNGTDFFEQNVFSSTSLCLVYEAERNNGERLKFLPNAKKS